MDTVTQTGLGAAVGEVVLGRQIGHRALLWGGICGLLPDLDVLVPLGDAVRNFTYHRGPSHSLFVLAALTPLMVRWILKFHPETGIHPIQDHWPVQRLQWFTHGFYAVQQIGGGIVMTDLRMGMEPDYTFRFRVASAENPHPVPEAPRRVKEPRNLKALSWIWHRISTDTAGASPAG
jgi:hypothetical protein